MKSVIIATALAISAGLFSWRYAAWEHYSSIPPAQAQVEQTIIHPEYDQISIAVNASSPMGTCTFIGSSN